jgi:signal transduction histidine kinase
MRSLVVFIVIFGTVGVIERRIRSEALRTEAALVLVERQRSAVLEAEERARKSIARLLHDQVQAALVTASLKLRQVQPDASPEVSERISSVVADLENLRSNQLRNVSQQLSPDFRVDGLDGALIRLGDSYNEAVDVLVRVTVPKHDWHAQVEPGLDMNLAAYRIVEQAVLNSAVHGQAAHVTVQILVDREHMSIEVVDDGSGIPSDFVPGTGHLVIDSWISSLGGNWSWEPGQHGGTALHAWIPIAK